MAAETPVEIRPVESRRDLDRFIRVPWPIYASDPNWIPPLIFERRQHLSSHNPYFEHARWQAWVAYRSGRPVGRITAQIDELYLQRYQEPTGFFGLLEAEQDPALFGALFQTAEEWLREQGMTQIQGPFNLSINQECGLLVDGFDTPPSVMMGHALPYYQDAVESAGYDKAKELLAYQYQLLPRREMPPIMLKLIGKYRERLQIRPLCRSRLEQEMETLRDIFNDAWSENWGFLPYTAEEFRVMGKDLTMLVGEDMIQIAELDGDAVAFIVVLPNINEAIRDLDGRLLPFGWARLLWRLKVGYPKTGRVPLMGVRKKYQNTRLGPALAFLVIDAVKEGVIRRGIRDLEMSWVLDDNAGMRSVLEAAGAVISKRYRIYQKSLI
jgi:GNAT superfamily N-acetyltransferase